MPNRYLHRLFEVFGLEIEYMIVDRDTFMPVSLAPVLLTSGDGVVRNSLQKADIAISNELASHIIELKSNPPTADLDTLARSFQRVVTELNATLAPHNAILAPGGMHPLMDPSTGGSLWEYDDAEIYAWYDQTFDCHRHGWLNLQSCHLNLPFSTEEEFARLHDAIILILPLLPALAASSPYKEGVATGFLDTRIDVYAQNQKRFPAITGAIIPEAVRTEETYRSRILAPAYAAVKPYDPQGLIAPDWLNSRGAIARFDRGAIEIRLLDTQEHPRADVAICGFIINVLKKLFTLGDETLRDLVAQFTPEERREHLMETARTGAKARFHQPELSLALGHDAATPTVGAFWKAEVSKDARSYPSVEYICTHGCLSNRITRRLPRTPSRDDLTRLVRDLATCLADDAAYPGHDVS